jgi:Flp pilus assembly protein TadD
MSALNIHRWFGPWCSRSPFRRAATEQVRQIRLAIRAGDIELASSRLDGCGEAGHCDAECLNLRGVIAECRGDWPLARRYWVRAARADKHCVAARQNLARYYELFTWGRCRDAVAMGDEPKVKL